MKGNDCGGGDGGVGLTAGFVIIVVIVDRKKVESDIVVIQTKFMTLFFLFSNKMNCRFFFLGICHAHRIKY